MHMPFTGHDASLLPASCTRYHAPSCASSVVVFHASLLRRARLFSFCTCMGHAVSVTQAVRGAGEGSRLCRACHYLLIRWVAAQPGASFPPVQAGDQLRLLGGACGRRVCEHGLRLAVRMGTMWHLVGSPNFAGRRECIHGLGEMQISGVLSMFGTSNPHATGLKPNAGVGPFASLPMPLKQVPGVTRVYVYSMACTARAHTNRQTCE